MGGGVLADVLVLAPARGRDGEGRFRARQGNAMPYNAQISQLPHREAQVIGVRRPPDCKEGFYDYLFECCTAKMLDIVDGSFESMTVADCCETIYSGGTPSTKKAEYWNGGLPWLSSGKRDRDSSLTPRRRLRSSARLNPLPSLPRRAMSSWRQLARASRVARPPCCSSIRT